MSEANTDAPKSQRQPWIVIGRGKPWKGRTYSKLTVIGEAFRAPKRMVVCECECGQFSLVLLNNLSRGNTTSCGCNKNGVWRLSNTAAFIARSIEIHGDRYDYSLVCYARGSDPVVIICPIHGEFRQTPEVHLMGCGCPECGGSRPITEQEWLAKAIEVHAGLYLYHEVKFVNMSTNVTVICRKHGGWQCNPFNHLKGHGCPQCGYDRSADLLRKGWEEFCGDVGRAHGTGTYDLSEANYTCDSGKVTVICKRHGRFRIGAGKLISGQGCRRCSRPSKGESRIAEWLVRHGFDFEPEKRFPSCRHRSTLPFDFFVPPENLLLEFDGSFHESPLPHFGGIPNFIRTKHRDGIKTRWAAENGYELLRISYRDMDRIPEILSERLLSGSVQMRLFAG